MEKQIKQFVYGKVKGHTGLGYYKAERQELLGSLESLYIGGSLKDVEEHIERNSQ